MISCETASSNKPPPAAMIGTAANCPAEVTFVMEIKTASNIFSPFSIAKIPKANETEK